MVRSRLRPIAASALEGAALAAAAGTLLSSRLGPAMRRPALVGLATAWGVSTAGTAALIWFRGAPFRTFLRAYGAGVALRGFVFVALSAAVWGGAWEEQAPLLSAYALGVLGLLIVEYRHLKVTLK